jgi:DNA polymerase/3'-5' exonuclease PolX
VSAGARVSLERAEALAARLVVQLGEHCERIEVAGSVRRQVWEVGDLELVVVPRWSVEPVLQGLFGPLAELRKNHLAVAVQDMIDAGELLVQKPGSPTREPWHLRDDGRYWRLWHVGAGMPLDVFLCDRDTWGLNLLIRTGSGLGPDGRPESGFAPAMLRRWKAVSGGGRAEGARLLRADGTPVATPEEHDVFEAVGHPWVNPERRDSSQALGPLPASVRARMAAGR